MKLITGFAALLGLVSIALETKAVAQNLPGSLSFTVSGSFENGVSQTSNSLLIADNNLTDGYAAGMDLQDVPTSLATSGPAGSAAFQWGQAASWTSYPHSSALWFEPIANSNIAPEQYFNIGSLFYRNGTITSDTGASAVDLALRLTFTNPSSVAPVSATFTSDLINTVNSSDPIASADIVSLRNLAAPLDFTDASGHRYYLELTFKVDQTTIDGSLSTQDQFRVFEGSQGRADLLGRFTTSPIGTVVPEPSAAFLSLLGACMFLRRKR